MFHLFLGVIIMQPASFDVSIGVGIGDCGGGDGDGVCVCLYGIWQVCVCIA